MTLADLNAIDFDSLRIVRETEDNDRFVTGRQKNSLGDITGLQLGLIGDLGKDNAGDSIDIKDIDFYHFTVSQPTQLNAVLEVDQAFQNIVNLNIFTDFNNDGTNNDGVPGDGFPDLLAGNRVPNGRNNRSLDRLSPVNQVDPKNQLAPGEYFLAVSNVRVRDGEPIDYEVKLEAPELQTAQLTLTIGDISPERDRLGQTPVRFEAEVAGQTFERRFETDFELTRLPVELDPSIQKTDITIRAFQLNDDGSETRIDLNGRIGEQELEVTFDSLTGRLFKQGTGINVNEGQSARVFGRNETSDAAGLIIPGFIALNATYDTTAELGVPPVTVPVPDPGDFLTIRGTEADDEIDGTASNERIFGLGGNDTISGNAGDDVLQGAGNPANPNENGKGEIDRLNGGAGEDTYRLHANNGMTVLYDDGNRRSSGKKDFAIIEDFNKNQDTIEVAGDRQDYFISRSNVRKIADGRAIFRDTDGDGRLRKGRDELIAVVEGSRNLSLDDLDFIDVPVTLGSNRAERLNGSGQDGILDGRGKRDVINAKDGNDIILGGNGDDVLNGGSGDDLLDGGKGNDQYRGQAGNDIFVIREGEGRDRIMDFTDGEDVIGLAQGLTFADLTIEQRGNNSIISLGDEALAVVKGVSIDQLGIDDFVAIGSTRFAGLTVPVALETD